ncbi:hypothetical protein APED_22840 [Acanthopleuribacter pedis]
MRIEGSIPYNLVNSYNSNFQQREIEKPFTDLDSVSLSIEGLQLSQQNEPAVSSDSGGAPSGGPLPGDPDDPG